VRFARVLAGLMLVAVVAFGCGDEGDDTGAAVQNTLNVEAFDFYFEPTTLSVDVGAEVTIDFTNSGSVVHSWTSTDLDAEVEAGAGEESSLTFVAPAEPGSYDYFCEYHPDEMQGTISIGGSDEEVEEVPEDEEDDDVDVDVDVDTEEDSDTGAGTDDY
jgi:plastocyanin